MTPCKRTSKYIILHLTNCKSGNPTLAAVLMFLAAVTGSCMALENIHTTLCAIPHGSPLLQKAIDHLRVAILSQDEF